MVRSNVRSESGGGTTGDGRDRSAGKSFSVTYARRAFLALALAVALHALVALTIPAFGSGQRGAPEVTARVTLARIEPRRVPHRVARARRHPSRVAAPAAPAASRDERSPKQSVKSGVARTHAVRASNTPVWGTIAATDRGIGAGTESGSGGGAGDGAGPGEGDQPCGFVTFSDPHGSRYDPSTHGFYVDIRMSVSFPDGHAESTILDYPFYYSSEAANPWSAANLNDPAELPRLQLPPPALAPGEPPLVQYVIAHSTADGLTLLQDCPPPGGAGR